MRADRLAWGVVVLVAACQPDTTPATSAGASVDSLADRYYEWAITRSPEQAYFAAVDLERHDGLFDNSPAARAEAERIEDAFFSEITAIDDTGLIGTPDWITKALLEQQLRASIAQRVCRTHLWGVNQMDGWHLSYTQIANLQPVETPEQREQSLARWSKFPAFIDQEIENLSAGIEQGYSSPKSVVARVVSQMDGLLDLELEASPFYSPAARAGDQAFAVATGELVEQQILPALQRYRDYLVESYLGAARTELSVTANPDGAACYEASLQAYTTLDRSGQEVYDLGRATVAANRADVIELGAAAYGLNEFADILDAVRSDPNDGFADEEEVLGFARDAVERARVEMPNWVERMPQQAGAVVPFEDHEEGTGRSAHYNPGNDDRPGEYRIPLDQPEIRSRGNAEATAFHEVWPGHHLQVATFQAIDGLHPVTEIIRFSGPAEGWGRYSEGLAEEMGLYATASGPILRRAWPARGMVVDPGIHLFGWTRDEAKEFMLESGRFPAEEGDAMVDRIAIWPGQLTAYDSGGLEILALRALSEDLLGEDFDVREFHTRVLENGTIPLRYLREHVEAWLAAKMN